MAFGKQHWGRKRRQEQSLFLGRSWLESKPTWWGDTTSRGGKGRRRRDAIDEKRGVLKWEGTPDFRQSGDTEIKRVIVKSGGRPTDPQGLLLNVPATRRKRRQSTGVGWGVGRGWGRWFGELRASRRSRACVSSQSLLYWSRPSSFPLRNKNLRMSFPFTQEARWDALAEAMFLGITKQLTKKTLKLGCGPHEIKKKIAFFFFLNENLPGVQLFQYLFVDRASTGGFTDLSCSKGIVGNYTEGFF